MQLSRLTVLLLALAVAAGCGDAGRLLSPDGAEPRFAVTRVTLTCPDTIAVGQSSQCQSYAYDENNNLVGTATFTYGTTTPSLITVNSSTGAITGAGVGSAVVQSTSGGVTSSVDVYVKPGLSVSIDGPGEVQRWTDCEWRASVSGGTRPYTYDWSASGGAGTSYGYYWIGQSISASMTLQVTVTDANGVQKTVSRYIQTSPSAPPCYL